MDYLIKDHEDIVKSSKLIIYAARLELDPSGYGELAKNPNTGNVYLWLEDYPFTLFIDFNLDLQACWSNPETGEEHFKTVNTRTTLNSLKKWIKSLEEKLECK